MQNAHIFRKKVRTGRPLIAAGVTLTDPIVSEVLCRAVDVLWIDAEHNPLTADVVQGHLLATQGRECPVLVRVPVGDANFVKHVLDAGADGIVAPQVRSAEEARRIVAACRYPPLGTRGFGPRRAVDYGDRAGQDYPRRANAEVLAFLMMEDIAAVREIDAILEIPGLDGVVIGPADLAASLGHIGTIDHPEVQAAIDTVIAKTRASGRILGVGGGDDVATARRWFERGVQWMQMGSDCGYLLSHVRRIVEEVRNGLA